MKPKDTTVDALAADPPAFTKVTFTIAVGTEECFSMADPGDVLRINEHAGEEPTGGRLVALVLARTPRPVPTRG